MRKKILVMLSLLASLTLFAACGGNGDKNSTSENTSGSVTSESSSDDASDESSVCEHTGGTATCTEKAECEKCGEEYGELAPHDYAMEKSDENNHWNECVCGDKADVEAHRGGSASCTEKAECEVCGTEYGGTGAHVYNTLKYDADSHWYECDCGAKNEESDVAHSGGTATCTTIATCEVCEQPYGDTSAHDYNELKYDDDSHWYECICGAKNEESDVMHSGGSASCTEVADCGVCGQPYGDTAAHDYSVMQSEGESHWNKCANCDATDTPVAHSYTLWDTENAVYDYKACVCGAVDETQFFKKKVALLNQELLMTDSAFALNINGISEYASVVGIKLGDYDLGTNISALTVSDELKADTKSHGKQTIAVTVKGADEAEHVIQVPVTLITKTIGSVDDFKTIKYTKENKAVYGYYVLTADLSDNSLTGTGYHDDAWPEEMGFFATFDGAGHTITTAANGVYGLFGVMKGATIKNLTINDIWCSSWNGAIIFGRASYGSTFENVTVTCTNGNPNVNIGEGAGWLFTSEFSNNYLKDVTITVHSSGIGSVFGYKFQDNTFDNVTINGKYTEVGHTAPVTDEDGNVTEGAKSVTYDDVTKAEAVKAEKITLKGRQDFILDGAVSTLDLGDYNDVEIISVKTSTGYDLYAISSDVATDAFKNATTMHGEQDIIVMAKTADGTLVEITVPVTVITKAISSMAELQTAVKHTGANLYGYYVLANDVAYTEEGYTDVNATYAWSEGTGFKGTLDGRNYTVTMAGNKSQHGLFGTLNGATVKNIKIVNMWYSGWGASTLGYTAYNTTFENITITIYGNTISATTGSVGAVIGSETGGCTWKDVTINVDQAQGTLFQALNKNNKPDTFENVIVNIPSLTQFSANGKPDGVTVNTTAA